jgi:uracil-DNA glycosylase family 4
LTKKLTIRLTSNVHELTENQQATLAAIGIECWELRSHQAAVSPELAELPSAEQSASWDELNTRIRACTSCGLHAKRTQVVCGVGHSEADCLIIGEAPGAEEDRQGEPFVGPAGQLLNEMLAAIGLARRTVFITNILKCRPPNNRDPSPAESEACMPFLEEQIALLKPRLIIVVGKVAAQNLLNTDSAIGSMRGNVYHHGDAQTPVVVTYHPAYLLRSPAQKAKSWSDLLMARDILEGMAT